MAKKKCPRDKRKAKGGCRTDKQLKGDRHRSRVMKGRAEPKTKKGKKAYGGMKATDYWCAPERMNVRTANGRWTRCGLLQHLAERRRKTPQHVGQLAYGPQPEYATSFGPLLQSGAYYSESAVIPSDLSKVAATIAG